MKGGKALGRGGPRGQDRPGDRPRVRSPADDAPLGRAELDDDPRRRPERAGRALPAHDGGAICQQFRRLVGRVLHDRRHMSNRAAATSWCAPRSTTPRAADVAIAYRLRASGGAWKIIDVFYKNSISQLATRRSDFAAVLPKGGAKALVAHLNALAAKAGGLTLPALGPRRPRACRAGRGAERDAGRRQHDRAGRHATARADPRRSRRFDSRAGAGCHRLGASRRIPRAIRSRVSIDRCSRRISFSIDRRSATRRDGCTSDAVPKPVRVGHPPFPQQFDRADRVPERPAPVQARKRAAHLRPLRYSTRRSASAACSMSPSCPASSCRTAPMASATRSAITASSPGPYLFLPFVGPTDLRDLLGGQADGARPAARGRPSVRSLKYQLPEGVVSGLDHARRGRCRI